MSTLLIKNAHIINPAKNEDFFGYILCENDKILEIAKGETDKTADETIDASGLVASPGFVDMHVHLRDPGLTYKEDIITGCNAAAAGGDYFAFGYAEHQARDGFTRGCSLYSR